MIQNISHLDYEERLKKLKLHSLYYRRVRGDLITVFKYLTGLITSENTDKMFPIADNHNLRGHQYKLNKVRSIHKVRYNFFTQRVVNMWNSLPSVVVNAPNICTFKNRLDSHLTHLHYLQTAPPRI